jgi:hypothetical protein
MDTAVLKNRDDYTAEISIIVVKEQIDRLA